ncbi:hypothetical protein PCASD_26326, partial [Puccinia coronata f. sp. avenae]
MLLPHFSPPNKISVPILKPIDFQVYPLISQATLEQLERSRQRCFIAKNQILKRSAEIRSKLNQHVHEQHVHVSPCPGSAERISLSPDPITKSSPLPGSPPCPSSDRLEELQPPAQSYTGGASPVAGELTLRPELQLTVPSPEDSPKSISSAETALWDRPRENLLKRPCSGRDSYSPILTKRANNRLSQTPLADHSYHIESSPSLPKLSIVGDIKPRVLENDLALRNPSGNKIPAVKTITPHAVKRARFVSIEELALPDLDYLFAPLDEKKQSPLPAHRARRATVGLKLEIDENVFPLINSCHSPRITYSCENTPATLSPFDEPAESLADDDPIRHTTACDQSTLFTKKPNQLPSPTYLPLLGKGRLSTKQLSNTRSALLVLITSEINAPKTRRIARPVRVGQIDFQNLPVLDERLRVSVEVTSRRGRSTSSHSHESHRIVPQECAPLADPSCRPVPLDDLRRALIATRDDMIQQLISACRHNNHPCNNLAEALQHKPIQATIFLHNKECLKTTVDLKRDFTPLGSST